jgi:hypothetical protein
MDTRLSRIVKIQFSRMLKSLNIGSLQQVLLTPTGVNLHPEPQFVLSDAY